MMRLKMLLAIFL